MKYISTRGQVEPASSAQAIKQGIAADGGLLVPETIPKISMNNVLTMSHLPYTKRAEKILSFYLTDYTEQELEDAAESAYGEESERFIPSPAPVVQLNKYNEQKFLLELWHGPTAAFKDIALQLLPHLMTAAISKTGDAGAKVCVLAATSGDTGKAALEGFRDVPGTAALVFYPENGVSDIQKKQMITQEGDNCHVIAIKGNFDDAQTGVKMLFADSELRSELKKSGIILSSANSINWGRLVPQIVYYFSAYADLVQQEKIEPGEPVNYVVPTGNFGNILAAWYARKMGLPVHKLICASNQNKVLSDFIRNGHYDRRRDLFRTYSPSMDILVSSNLERLLFELTGRSEQTVQGFMEALQKEGHYQIDAQTLKALQEVFVGGFADDAGTLRTIREVYDLYDHMIDTHTAVGFNVYSRYQARSNDQTKTIFVSTASPFKFSEAVCSAIYDQKTLENYSPEARLNLLSEESGLEIPLSLADLEQKPIRHTHVISVDKMRETVLELLTGSR
jgi:threonine synthase